MRKGQTVTPPVEATDRRKDTFDAYVLPELPVLYRCARAMSAQPADAEDLVQETLLRAFRAIGRFDGRHPRAWLMTIMRRVAVNRSRRQGVDLLGWEGERGREVTVRSAEDQVVEAAFDDAMGGALAGLSAKLRPVVELIDVQGLTYAEAARALDLAEGTVVSRLHRARKRIRRHLDQAATKGRLS